jgi:RNA polymerase sigma factor (sigma-70 family)
LCVFSFGGFYIINAAMNPTDQELLRQYAQGPSESAFTAVVERHVNLVYSAALRLTAGDAALAEDITQKVFTDLAHKAATVARAASVAGWLHTHTRFISLTAIRGERRRRIREQEAFAMHDPNNTPEINWSQLRPLLDEAVGELRPVDRDAVILRFFENKSHREVGETLGLNENAARMKIERALEKLQTHFVRRGVTVSSAVIATAMSANSVQAAPVGLGSKVAGASLVKSAGAVGFVQAIWSSCFMSTTAKVITTAVIAALIASMLLTIEYRSKANRLALPMPPTTNAPKLGTQTAQVEKPSALAVPPKPETTESVHAADVQIDANSRASVQATLSEANRLIQSDDIAAFIREFMLPPDAKDAPPGAVNEVVQATEQDPEALQGAKILMTDLNSIQGQTPIMSDNGNTATYKINNMPFTLKKQDGVWYIGQFVDMYNQAPVPQPVGANPASSAATAAP